MNEQCDYCDQPMSRRHIEVTGLIEDAEQDVRWFCNRSCLQEFLYHRSNPEPGDERPLTK